MYVELRILDVENEWHGITAKLGDLDCRRSKVAAPHRVVEFLMRWLCHFLCGSRTDQQSRKEERALMVRAERRDAPSRAALQVAIVFPPYS